MHTTSALRRRIGGTLAVAGLALTSTACPDDTDPIPPEEEQAALLVLETPGTDEGALLFILDGPAEVEIEPASASHRVFSRDLPGGGMRVAVIGNLSEGVVLELTLPEGEVTDYDAALEQVADRQNNLRPSLSGYSLLIEAIGD